VPPGEGRNVFIDRDGAAVRRYQIGDEFRAEGGMFPDAKRASRKDREKQ